jgi:hypothetical protein
MAVITAVRPSVNPDLIDLPYEFVPGDDDARWAAETFGESTVDFDVEPDDIDELAALEAAFLDAHELGLISTEVAEYLSRSSLVGLADEITADAILHFGSNPVTCLCERCVEVRTRHYAD